MKLIATALKWFDSQGSVSDYEGGRDLDSLANLYAFFFRRFVVLNDVVPQHYNKNRGQIKHQAPSPSRDGYPRYSHFR
jgi:hypothetical protein